MMILKLGGKDTIMINVDKQEATHITKKLAIFIKTLLMLWYFFNLCFIWQPVRIKNWAKMLSLIKF